MHTTTLVTYIYIYIIYMYSRDYLISKCIYTHNGSSTIGVFPKIYCHFLLSFGVLIKKLIIVEQVVFIKQIQNVLHRISPRSKVTIKQTVLSTQV